MARLPVPPEVPVAVDPGDSEERVAEPSRIGWLRRLSRRTWAAVVAVLVVAGIAAFVALRDPGPPPLTQRDVDQRVSAGLEAHDEEEARAPAEASVAYATIQPSLVLITTRGANAEGEYGGTGAGVIVNAMGTVLTALHVVEDADSITVAYTDGTSSPATIASADPDNDIAALVPETPPETVVPAVLGGGVQVGTPVYAVGHPLGLPGSLSAGVVSALDRDVRVDGNRRLENLIQIDAAVNPGNSGGPLLNSAGQVVGIVTGLANPNDESLFVGIGFAVPIATAGGTAGGPPR
ncbi:MAG TPA: trypsin-like peptidase domain-containing protein [Intrasporangium sp.]|uniref:S1C family serine protease n=1 Tax=Intrasporangium sp. TaxID=1925024 RepID=UPI002B482A5D|nr:trypsin-like peptidase domain-containing protein [Intrasporangium sp.]HKX66340.1 trypsin-like peptidase domain-containing protein [Intrasporangium sp.]